MSEIELGWNDVAKSTVIQVTKDWVVSVTPMIFNDRVILSSKDEWPDMYTAGWCYDKGGSAALAAMAWDPETQNSPVGFKKVACDSRRDSDLPEGKPESVVDEGSACAQCVHALSQHLFAADEAGNIVFKCEACPCVLSASVKG